MNDADASNDVADIEVRSYFPTSLVVARGPLGLEENSRLRDTIPMAQGEGT